MRLDEARRPYPRIRTFGTAANSAGVRIRSIWSRESILRLLLSFILSLALWLYVTDQQDPEVATFGEALPISTANVPTNLTLANTLGSVHVQIRLDNHNMLVTPANFHVFVNLAGLGPGLHPHVPVVVVPDPGITVVHVDPPTVPISLEVRLTKHVPVRWHILQVPPAGFATGNVSIVPSSVTISGPRSIVSQVADAGVYLYLAQARSSVEGSYRPTLENLAGDSIEGAGRLLVDPPQVQVSVPINSLSSYKTLPVLVSLREQPAQGFGVVGVSVTPPEITAHGSPSILGKTSFVRTYSVSLGGRRAGTFREKVGLVLPRGVGVHDRTVTITVQLAPVSGSSALQIAVSPTGVAPGLAVRIHPSAVLVTVVGQASALSGAARSIRATVDVTGDGVGTYAVTPKVNVPRGLQVEGVYPSTVTVNVVPVS